MTKAEVKKFLVSATPFEELEFEDDILNLIIFRALLVINRYKPYKFLTSDIVNLDDTGTNYYPVTLEMKLYQVQFTITPWNISDIQNSSIYHHFLSLLEGYAYMYLANKRRVMQSNDLFYDLKGDQFFDYGTQLIEQTIQYIENSIDSFIG